MRKTTTIFLFALLGLFSLLLGGCSSGGGDGGLPTPPPKFYFKASNTQAGDLFAKSVALSGDGNTLAIGAWAENSADPADESNNGASGAGAVYVFTRSVAGDGTVSWSQLQYVKAPTPVAGENFGYSVSLSEDGSKLAVGAPDISGASPGKVYVYQTLPFDTAPTEIINPAGAVVGIGDRFGQSVALSEDGFRLAIGAPAISTSAKPGTVYVFEDMGDANAWTQEDSFSPSMDAGAGLGISVALNQDGSVLAAGAWLENGGMGADEGAVYWTTRDAMNVWDAAIQLKASIPAANNRFGTSVALSDDGFRLAVGTPGDFLGGGGFTGATYVYTDGPVAGTDWTDEQIITASNAEADDAFGLSVALSDDGTQLIVGSSYEDGSDTGIGGTPDNTASNAGAAYLFEFTTGWSEVSYIKATNTDAGDQFGTSVSMDDTGNRVAIGAVGEASNATGVNGDQTDNSEASSGATYLWNL